MATWWTLTFEGEPTEADFRRVSEMAAQGMTSGQLINDAGGEAEEGPATGYAFGELAEGEQLVIGQPSTGKTRRPG